MVAKGAKIRMIEGIEVYQGRAAGSGCFSAPDFQ